jgi:head-tail adaptor
MAKKLNELSGRLSQRIAVQQRIGIADGIGGVAIAWQTIMTIYAEIAIDGSDERRSQGRITAPQRLRIRCRAEHALTTQQRIIWRANTFTIVQLIIDPASPAEIVFYAEKVTL